MFTNRDDFRVKKTIGSSWNVDEDDVVKTKTALKKTGDYKAPDWGVTGYPDQDMFDGLKSFQKREGLQVDGVMKPGGPTETRLRQKLQPPRAAETVTASTMARKSDPANAGTASPQPKNREAGYGGLPVLSGIKLSPGTSVPPVDTSQIGQELPGGRTRGPARKEKRPGEQEVAFAPLVPIIAAGGAALVRNGPQILRGLQGFLRAAPPLVGAADAARKQVERSGDTKRQYPSPIPQPPEDEDPSKDRSNRVAIDPPPPTPGFEPPDEKLPDRTERPADPVEVDDLTGSLPDVQEPTIFVFPAAKPNEFGNGIVERKGNEATRKELERIRDYFRSLGWKHIAGGRYAADDPAVLAGTNPKVKPRAERGEYHIPGPGKAFKADTRRGGHFTDLTFKDDRDRTIHIQSVDVDRYGKPTKRELDNAERIRRAEKNTDVLLIPKGAQLKRNRK